MIHRGYHDSCQCRCIEALSWSMRESAQSRSSVACDLLCINWGSLIPQMDYSVLSYIRNEQVEISVLRRITIRVIPVEVLTQVVGCLPSARFRAGQATFDACPSVATAHWTEFRARRIYATCALMIWLCSLIVKSHAIELAGLSKSYKHLFYCGYWVSHFAL